MFATAATAETRAPYGDGADAGTRDRRWNAGRAPNAGPARLRGATPEPRSVVREASPGSAEPDPTPTDFPSGAASPKGAPVMDPFEDQDALVEMGDEIVRLAAHDHAIRHRILQLIAEFDRRGGWHAGSIGCRGPGRR